MACDWSDDTVFTSDKNRPTNQKPAITHRDEIYFIDFWRENLSMYRINTSTSPLPENRKDENRKM